MANCSFPLAVSCFPAHRWSLYKGDEAFYRSIMHLFRQGPFWKGHGCSWLWAMSLFTETGLWLMAMLHQAKLSPLCLFPQNSNIQLLTNSPRRSHIMTLQNGIVVSQRAKGSGCLQVQVQTGLHRNIGTINRWQNGPFLICFILYPFFIYYSWYSVGQNVAC